LSAETILVGLYRATDAWSGRISSLSSHEGDTGSVESFWPCVGATRIVPDYISLFPQSAKWRRSPAPSATSATASW